MTKEEELTQEQANEIFQRLWSDNIWKKGKNEPPSLEEFIEACKEACSNG